MADFPPRFKKFDRPISKILGQKVLENTVSWLSSSGNIAFKGEFSKTETDTEVCGSVGVQYQAPHNVTFSARADTKNAKLASVEYKPDAVKGLKIKVKGKQAEQNAVLVGARYRRKYVAVDAEVDVLPQSNSVHQMKTSVAVGTRGFFVGALAQLHLTPASCEKGEQTEGAETTGKKLCCDYLAGYQVGAAYAGSDYLVHIGAAEDLSVVKAGYFHRLSQGLQVGAQITFPGKVEQGHKSTNEFALAVQHNTKDHRSMKLKFDYNGTEGGITGSYTAPLVGGANLTVRGRVRKSGDVSVGLQAAFM